MASIDSSNINLLDEGDKVTLQGGVNTAQSISNLLYGKDVTTSVEGSGREFVTTGKSPEVDAQLKSILNFLSSQMTQYGADQAKAYGESAFELALKDTLKTYMPQVAAQLGKSGFSTSSSALNKQEDIAIKATLAGQQAELNALKAFADIISGISQSATAISSQTAETKDAIKEESSTNKQDEIGVWDRVSKNVSSDTVKEVIEPIIPKKEDKKRVSNSLRNRILSGMEEEEV